VFAVQVSALQADAPVIQLKGTPSDGGRKPLRIDEPQPAPGEQVDAGRVQLVCLAA